MQISYSFTEIKNIVELNVRVEGSKLHHPKSTKGKAISLLYSKSALQVLVDRQ